MKKGWITAGVIGMAAIPISVSIYMQVSAEGPVVEIGQPKQEEISSTVMIPGTVELDNQQTIYPPRDHKVS